MKNLCELHPRLEKFTGMIGIYLWRVTAKFGDERSIRRIVNIETSSSESGDEWSFVGLKAGF